VPVARVCGGARAQAPDPTTLYRVFLRDGSTIVSYGEYARVADKVVVSLPLGGTPSTPDLQLLSLRRIVSTGKERTRTPSRRVRRATRRRAGPDDFALLSNAVTIALTTSR
jgi:hypothetical protein